MCGTLIEIGWFHFHSLKMDVLKTRSKTLRTSDFVLMYFVSYKRPQFRMHLEKMSVSLPKLTNNTAIQSLLNVNCRYCNRFGRLKYIRNAQFVFNNVQFYFSKKLTFGTFIIRVHNQETNTLTLPQLITFYSPSLHFPPDPREWCISASPLFMPLFQCHSSKFDLKNSLGFYQL